MSRKRHNIPQSFAHSSQMPAPFRQGGLSACGANERDKLQFADSNNITRALPGGSALCCFIFLSGFYLALRSISSMAAEFIRPVSTRIAHF